MKPTFEILSEGNVVRSHVGEPTSVVVAGPRCVATRDGSVLVTYMAQSKLGINDFVPTIMRSDSAIERWSDPKPIWADVSKRYSMFCNISAATNGELFIFGSRTYIEVPGEPFWQEENQGIKENDLFWSRSLDDGRTWTSPQPFPLPYPGSAEVPGTLLVTRKGRWIGVYAPYNTFDKSLRVERERLIAVCSDDQGATWKSSIAMRFDEPNSGGAEAWVTQLTDGRLLSTTWHADMSGAQKKFPNRYAISHDEGNTWTPSRSTGIVGNTTALTPLPDNRALFITVRRGKDDAGIWLSIVKPNDHDFGVISDQCVWSNAQATKTGETANHANWTKFTYGEPCVSVLPDGTFLMVFWYLDDQYAGVRYLKLKLNH